MAVRIVPILEGSPPKESHPCWKGIKNGFCRSVDVLTRAGGLIIEAISGLFFGTLRIIWPKAADKVEALWGRITTIYERVKGKIREKGLKENIQKLESDKQFLEESMNNLAVRVEGIRIEKDHFEYESGLLQEERDKARIERDNTIYGRAHLIRGWNQFIVANRQLEKRLYETLQEKEGVIEEKKRQKIERDQALQEVVVIRNQLKQRDRQDALIVELNRIHEVYNENKLRKGRPVLSELELERLIPLYEAQKVDYQNMIQKILNDLSPDHALQVPLNGILTICNEELGHLKRMSEAMLFYSALQDPIEQILTALRQHDESKEMNRVIQET